MPRKRQPRPARIICRTCQVEKSSDDFRPKRRQCRQCDTALQGVHHMGNRDEALQYMKDRRRRIREQRQAGLLPAVDVTQPTLCKTCGEIRPLGEFRKNHNSLTGFVQPCAQCASQKVSQRSKETREKRRNGMMPPVDTSIPWICTQCGETKPMHEFVTASGSATGHAQPCILCMRIIAKEYYQNHPEKAKEWRERNPEKVVQAAQKWQKNNPDKVRGHWAARRARKRNAWVENVDYGVLYERDHGICQLQYPGCKVRLTKKQGTVDHIVPLALDGEHSYKNCQLACRHCNFKKQKTGKGDQMRLF